MYEARLLQTAKMLPKVVKNGSVAITTDEKSICAALEVGYVGAPYVNRGVLLTRKVGKDTAFVLLYTYAYDLSREYQATHPKRIEEGVRGMAGFVYANKFYCFDRTGVDDSWYPTRNYRMNKQVIMPQGELVAEMVAQLERAEKRLASYQELKATGVDVNFGPTTRTLSQAQITEYKATLKNRRSFSLNPSGFGTGYRFYVPRGRPMARYGQGMPASAQARTLLDAPTLVYDTTDCD